MLLSKLPLIALGALWASAAPGFALQEPLASELVASGFAQPVGVAAPAGDSESLYVIERGGRVRILRDGAVLDTPFLDIADRVAQIGFEAGLLGLAFHPDYETEGWVYVHYTEPGDFAVVVERFRAGADPDQIDLSTSEIVFGPFDGVGNGHFGGGLQFGPDGKLYVGIGDGDLGVDHQPGCGPQDLASPLGKVLRLNDDGTYPSDNPFAGDPLAHPGVYLLGVRNPWRFSFDETTQGMYLGDVGDDLWEEIDFIPDALAGANLGWPIHEGTSCFDAPVGCPAQQPACEDASYLDPLIEYDHTVFGCAIVGGFVYRGCQIPSLRGSYFFGDWCSGRVFSIPTDTPNPVPENHTAALAGGDPDALGQVTSFGLDGEGELYFTSLTGEVRRIVSALPNPSVDLGQGTPGSGGLEPSASWCGATGPGQVGEILLDSVLASSLGFLVASFDSDPMPLLGGSIVPALPAFLILPIETDASGSFVQPVVDISGPIDLVLQFILVDPEGPAGFAMSNALGLAIAG